jgi:hypothetical protein
MSARFVFLAALLTTVIPILVSAGALFVMLPWWADTILRSDLSLRGRIEFVVSNEYVGWAASSNQAVFRDSLYRPVLYAALIALAITLIQAVVFASASAVPILWFLSGIIASVVVSAGAFVVIWLAKTPLLGLINRTLSRHANDKFVLATQTVLEIREIAQQIDDAYASMGLQTRTNVLELCRQALLEPASLGAVVSAQVDLVRIKTKSEHDLRCVQYLATLFANARTKLEQVKVIHGTEALQNSIKKIEGLIYSQDLADTLKDARWPDARELLKRIESAVEQLLDSAPSDSTMPESVEDAYRILNVSEQTPLRNIKAVVNAYRRVWHPDLARDEVESHQFKLRIQQINVAWDIIRKACELSNHSA